MKKLLISVICIVTMLASASAFADTGTWTSISVDQLFPQQDGSIEVRYVNGQGQTEQYVIPSDHANKKELYGLLMLAGTLNQSVTINYVDNGGENEVRHVAFEF